LRSSVAARIREALPPLARSTGSGVSDPLDRDALALCWLYKAGTGHDPTQ